MASLMFRAKSDNKFYAEAQKPKGAGTWYVFFYDTLGKKVRQRIGAHKGAATLAKGEIEAKLAKQRAGLLDPEHEIQRVTIQDFLDQLEELLTANNKSKATVKRYLGVFSTFVDFLSSHEAHLKDLNRVEQRHVETFKDHRRQVMVSPNGHPNSTKRKGVSVRTINNELTYLHSIFNLAVDRGYDRETYEKRNEVERLFRRLKGFRRIFTRFEKLNAMFTAFISFALAVDAIR